MDTLNLTRELTAQGFSSEEIARLTRSGGLHRIRRGAYRPADATMRSAPGDQSLGQDEERHRWLVQATVRQSSAAAVVSHQSAAVLHGLPVWSGGLSKVHLSRDRANGAKVARSIHLHSGPLLPSEVTEVAGIPVTTLARTAVDVGRSTSLFHSVPVVDAALAAGLVTDDLELALAHAAGRVGVAAARRMAAFGDGRSESAGESTSRVVLSQAGLPSPDLQHEVFDHAGRLVGRTDFCWEDRRTVGEFDGRVKYGRLLKPGQSAGDVIYAEKVREDLLRDLGWQVVRWTWDDLLHPGPLIERLLRAFDRGRRLI